MPDDIVGQSFFLAHNGKFTILETIQSASERAEPKRPVSGRINAFNKIRGKPVGFFEPRNFAFLQPHQTRASRAKPKRTGGVRRNRAHIAEWFAIDVPEVFERSILITKHAPRGPDPKSVSLEQKCRRGKEKIFQPRRKIKKAVGLRVHAPTPRTRPYFAGCVRSERPD